MRSLPLFLAVAALLSLAACDRGLPPSPQNVTMQFERSIPILRGMATIAMRLEDAADPAVLLHVECDDTNETVHLVQTVPSPELCGITFELRSLNFQNGTARSANLRIKWGDDPNGSGASE